MGIPDRNVRRLSWIPLGFMALVPFVLWGCDSGSNQRVISSAEFSTPDLVSMRSLSSKLALLKAISPSTLDNELLQQRARARPLGKLDRDTLLVYESDSGAILSVDYCRACSSPAQRARIDLHYNRSGLEEELFKRGVVSQDPSISFDTVGDIENQGVKPIELKSPGFEGWFLALETSSRSLVAFKRDPRFRRVPSGLPNPEASGNFGRGNGLLMSVVISGQDIARQADAGTPRISRIFELSGGKILAFFLTLREVHLLELTLEPASLDFDLDSSDDPPVEVMVPRGTFRTFDPGEPGLRRLPFLSFKFIQENVTQNSLISLDTYQPVLVPAPGKSLCDAAGGLPEDGRALVYDFGSASFIEIWEDLDPSSPRFGMGEAREVARQREISTAVEQGAPYFMSESVYLPDCQTLWVFEEDSNTMLGYDLSRRQGRGRLSTEVGAVSFLLRRDPTVVGGGDGVPSGEEPVLLAAENDVQGSRLFFDQGRDQLVSIDFEQKSVVIVADRQDFEAVTQRPLANVTFLEKIGSSPDGSTEELRMFDSESTTLLEVELDHIMIPVEDRNK